MKTVAKAVLCLFFANIHFSQYQAKDVDPYSYQPSTELELDEADPVKYGDT